MWTCENVKIKEKVSWMWGCLCTCLWGRRGREISFINFYSKKLVSPKSSHSGDSVFLKWFLRLWRTPAHMAQMMLVCKEIVVTAGRGSGRCSCGCPSISEDPEPLECCPLPSTSEPLLLHRPWRWWSASQLLHLSAATGHLKTTNWHFNTWFESK